MNPISLSLNLLLAALLLATLMLGGRLNQKLKALKDSHSAFAAAVAELNQAATRAERGLSELRAATDETMEFLTGRIEKGRELATKLERLNASAAATVERASLLQSQAEPEARPHANPLSQISALQRAWAKPANEPTARAAADPEAAAESLVLKLSEALKTGDVAMAHRALRSRAPAVDDDLFDAPQERASLRAMGAR